MTTETLRIEKLVFGGQGLARNAKGQVVFVWNALPGELVEIQYIKRKKDHLQAIATDILEPSPDRVEPKDDHYLSSSPWQMMSESAERTWKKAMAIEAYNKIGELILSADQVDLCEVGDAYGYRNKMEFSFAPNENDEMCLAFFRRGKNLRVPIQDAHLAHPAIMTTANEILAWIRKHNIPHRSLKSLIVRSTQAGDSLAALFIKDRLPFDDYPELSDSLKGFHLYYSTHKSPASVVTDTLYTAGQDYLEESILGTTLRFGLLSFFQINPPIFEEALKDIAAFLDPKAPLLDFYAGVGAIGLPLAGARGETVLVESNQQAIDYANVNIQENNIQGATAHCLPAEKILEVINGNKQIVVDPPRAGLHKDVVSTLLKAAPEKIIYLSCNISTQARDMRMLSSRYKPIFIKLYNFFPRTPHVEGLVVLEKLR